MRSLIKALSVLAFLLVPTALLAQSDTETRFIRIQKDAKGDPVALQTATAKYVLASGEKGVEIDLVSVVHVGEKSYYQSLGEQFGPYDAVLYELVAPEGTKPSKERTQESSNPLALMQMGMKMLLRLDHQLETVDYHKPNFIHADLSLDGLKKLMKDRGQDEMTVMFAVLKELVEKMHQNAGKQESQIPEVSEIEDLFKLLLNPAPLKRAFAQQLADAGGDIAFGKTFNQYVVVDRNNACLEVLRREIKAGKKKIAIFYGGAHMPDFDKRLTGEEFRMKRVSTEWQNAWNL